MRKVFFQKHFLIFFFKFFWGDDLEALLPRYLFRYPHYNNYSLIIEKPMTRVREKFTKYFKQNACS